MPKRKTQADLKPIPATQPVIQDVVDKQRAAEEEMEKSHGTWRIVLISVILVGIAFGIFVVSNFALTAKESANSTLNEPVVPQPVQIAPVPAIKQNIVDISTYAADPSLYLNKQVSFLSYLKHEIRGNENNSVNSYFALDDAGRKLELSSISADERMHFPYNSTSNTVYNVTGVIRKTAKGYAVTVASLAVQ